jgi:hypothetical protein
MFCCGAWKSRTAPRKLSQSRARPMRRIACTVRSSSASAVQASAIAWPRGAASRAATSASEITGPWRDTRTSSFSSGAPFTLITSSKVSNRRRPSGAT